MTVTNLKLPLDTIIGSIIIATTSVENVASFHLSREQIFAKSKTYIVRYNYRLLSSLLMEKVTECQKAIFD